MSVLSRFRALTGRSYRRASPHAAAALVEGGALLLDVREKSELNAGHAPLARNVPLSRLAGHVSQVPEDRTIVTVCRAGARSAHAARLLARQGYDVVNLSGGMHAWQRVGLGVVGSAARQGRVA
jgi:rhodanese-related sulfurtransferase